MNLKSLNKCSLILLLMLITPAFSKSIYAQSICPDPNRPCGTFKPYELPFRIPPSQALARPEDRSAQFYAIILKTAEPCSVSEDERQAAQTLFPRNKVFASRFECDAEDIITYSTTDHSKHGILGVYAGKTKREAGSLLTRARRTGRFPGAYVRRMAVVRVHP